MKAKKMDDFTLDMIYMAILFVLVIVIAGFFNFAFGGGDNRYSQQAQSAVEKQGYTNIVLLGLDYLSCASNGDGANAGYAFEATNVNGVRVMLTACKHQGFLHPFGGWYIVTQ